MSQKLSRDTVPNHEAEPTFGTVLEWILGTRGSLPPSRTSIGRSWPFEAAGILADRIYVDKKSGATTNRPSL